MKKVMKGQAAILIIFVIGMVSLLIGTSLTRSGFAESLMGRRIANSTSAFYVANSGIEDAFYKIQKDDFDYSIPLPDLIVGDGMAKVTVTKGGKCKPDEIEIVSIGKYKNFIRKLRVCTCDTSTKPGFGDAIHAGLGGLEMEGNTLVSALKGADGNVYSNSYIKGEKANDCDKSESTTRIIGSAWAHSDITRLGDAGSENKAGICVEKNAYANNLLHCYVKNVSQSPNLLGTFCTSEGGEVTGNAPDIIDLPNMGIGDPTDLKVKNSYPKDCILDGTNGPDDCSYGTYKIGDIKINGKLTINPKDPNHKVEIDGPVWVTGDITINSNTLIGPEKKVMKISQLIVADGKIITNAGVKFSSNPDPEDPVNKAAFLLFISTFKPNDSVSVDNWCKDEKSEENYSIKLSSNTDSVLFYATKGCVLVNANGTFQGAILGQKVKVITNSDILYDPRLKNAIFGLTKEGGWQILSFTE